MIPLINDGFQGKLAGLVALVLHSTRLKSALGQEVACPFGPKLGVQEYIRKDAE